jgi:hypothetical protein
MRRVIGVAAVLALSACSLGSHESKPKPPPPAPLIALSCEQQLTKIDEQAAGALVPVEAKQQEIADRRHDLRPSLQSLRKAERVLKAAAARLKAFDAAHPGKYLAPSIYSYWRGLRDDYGAAYAAYKQRFKRFRPFQRDFNAVVKEGKALWKSIGRIDKSYEKKLHGCLGPRPLIARREANRIRQLQRRLEDIAADVSGRSVSVRCETARAWEIRDTKFKGDLLGYVLAGGRTIHLAPSICYAFHRLRYLTPKPDLSCLNRSRSANVPLCSPRATEIIRVAVTLAHESQHVAGIASEKKAECFGLQKAALVARRLGVPPSVSDQLAWYGWHFSEAPRSYQSRQCRDGGKLDRDPSSTSFP